MYEVVYYKEDMIRIHLSRLLGERKMRVIDLSRLTGIDQHALAKLYYENAKGIQLDTLEKICVALNCTVADLLEYTPDEQREGKAE
jgi:putative transcriptional regulator